MAPQIEDLYEYYSDSTELSDWHDRQKQIANNFICIFLLFFLLIVTIWLVQHLKRCILKRKQKSKLEGR